MEPGVEPDRAIFWKKARKRKNGQEVEDVDEELQVVCDTIVSLLLYWHTSRASFIINMLLDSL